MKKSGLLDTSVYLTSDDFEEYFGIERLDSITVNCLPSEFEGKLLLGNTPVVTNQTIYKKDIKGLHFSPASPDTKSAAFLFSVNNISIQAPVRCSLYLFSEINCSPVISQRVSKGEKLSTLENIMVFSSVSAEDGENDAMTFEITTPPEHGIACFTDSDGAYTYTPSQDYVGKDRFEFCVVDEYGNRSERAWVNIVIEKNKGNVFFKDMIARPEHLEAVKAAQYDIMSGKLIKGEMCFSPDSPITKAEFLQLALTTVGIAPDSSSVTTAFADDSDIPAKHKGYVISAAQRGYISGVKTDNGVFFYPNSPITSAEAASIIRKIIESVPSLTSTVGKSSVIQSSLSDDTSVSTSIKLFELLSDSAYSPDSVITNAVGAEVFSRLFEMAQEK